jgi:hypothetical protein
MMMTAKSAARKWRADKENKRENAYQAELFFLLSQNEFGFTNDSIDLLNHVAARLANNKISVLN